MFADFRVHGLKMTFFQCFHPRSTPTYEKGRASPGFPVEFEGNFLHGVQGLPAVDDFVESLVHQAAHLLGGYMLAGLPRA